MHPRKPSAIHDSQLMTRNSDLRTQSSQLKTQNSELTGADPSSAGGRAPLLTPVVLAASAAFLNLYATQPLLPLLARTFHASAFEVGLTITAPTVAVAIAAPLVGRFADMIGLRRVIVWSTVLLAATTALAGTSGTLGQLIGWRFLQGVVTPGVFACTVAYIHEMWPAERAGRTMSFYMSGTIVGGFVGRALTGLIAAHADWRLSFAVIAAIVFGIGIVLWRFMPPEPAHARPDAVEPRQAIRALFRNRQLVATYAIGFCVLFTNVAMFTYVTFQLAAPPYSLSTAALGWLFVVYLVGAVVMPLGGVWIDAYGHRAGMASAMTIGAAGALLTLLPSLGSVVAGLALTSTGVFLAQTTTISYIGAVTERDRALAVGLYSTFYYAGGSAGGSAPAPLWDAAGWPGCVGLVVLVQLTGAAIALMLWAPAQSRAAVAARRLP
jgi:YNFM family putative membrane transporter